MHKTVENFWALKTQCLLWTDTINLSTNMKSKTTRGITWLPLRNTAFSKVNNLWCGNPLDTQSLIKCNGSVLSIQLGNTTVSGWVVMGQPMRMQLQLWQPAKGCASGTDILWTSTSEEEGHVLLYLPEQLPWSQEWTWSSWDFLILSIGGHSSYFNRSLCK